MSKHKPSDVRREQILTAAVAVAIKNGYVNFKRSDVAAEAGVSTGSINKHYGTMSQLRRAVMRNAVLNECLQIIAEGLVVQDRYASKASDVLKTKALMSLIED